jgi:DNA-damage-inducible protein D
MSQIQPANGFEAIRHLDEEGREYWLAREIAPLLDYAQFRNFQPVIEKAREACRNSQQDEADHFADMRKMVEIGSGAFRPVEDVQLSRYACYLIVQNADPAKPIIALGQTYFTLQTRRQELGDAAKFAKLSEDERRLAIRNELSEHNKALSAAAKGAGVETPLDYAVFQDHGYKGLYGGLGAKDLHNRRGLKKSDRILDHMGSTELAANLFRATQAEEKLKRESIKGKVQANKAHFEVGAKVRQTIKELGSTMPENLPTPDKSIKQIERERSKQLPKPPKGRLS